eukprot:g75672.t1
MVALTILVRAARPVQNSGRHFGAGCVILVPSKTLNTPCETVYFVEARPQICSSKLKLLDENFDLDSFTKGR